MRSARRVGKPRVLLVPKDKHYACGKARVKENMRKCILECRENSLGKSRYVSENARV